MAIHVKLIDIYSKIYLLVHVTMNLKLIFFSNELLSIHLYFEIYKMQYWHISMKFYTDQVAMQIFFFTYRYSLFDRIQFCLEQ